MAGEPFTSPPSPASPAGGKNSIPPRAFGARARRARRDWSRSTPGRAGRRRLAPPPLPSRC